MTNYQVSELSAKELQTVEGGCGFWCGIAGAALYDFLNGVYDGFTG